MSVDGMSPDTQPSGASSPLGWAALTATHLATERRDAARSLLGNPVLTAATHPEELALVRRHGTALKQTFHTQLGYPLVVEASFARLVKPPLPADAPPRGARRSNGTALTPRAYTFLALFCAGLLAPGTGEQVVMSSLVEQLRADAATAGIDAGDNLTDRRAMVAALGLLIDWGLLSETDGTVAAWGERREEALLSVNRALLPHVLARPLANLTGPEALWEPDPGAVPQPRRDLRRRLTENPLTRREVLTDAEADALSRERRELTRAIDDAFGLTLEVRVEGALAYDTAEELTDLTFPGNGTVRQAALLLVDAATDILKPTAGSTAYVDGAEVPGLLVAWPTVTEELADLAHRNARVWRHDVAHDIDALQHAVVELLVATALAAVTDAGLVLHPACARYRPEPVRAPARARRTTTNAPDPAHPVDPSGTGATDDPLFS